MGRRIRILNKNLYQRTKENDLKDRAELFYSPVKEMHIKFHNNTNNTQ